MIDTSHFLIRTLLDDGVITDADAQRANEHAIANAMDLVDAIVAIGVINSHQLAITRAKMCEYPFVDLNAYNIDIHNATRLPRSVAERIVAFPLFCFEHCATIGMADPLNLQAIDQLRQLLKVDIEPVLCDPDQLRALISRAYTLVRTGGTDEQDATDRIGANDSTTGDEPIVAAVNQIISAAVQCGASDIHINPDENALHVRYRVDGVLALQQGPDMKAHAGIIQRLKVMAHLDLTQTRRPQDGKFRYMTSDSYVDIRLSLLPTIHGENAVMRLLRPASAIGTVEELGMPADVRESFQSMVSRPHGMILVTGPTGSGKTTTLYTALAEINTPDRNVMTIEDPVELRLPMIRQIQVNAEIGLTFASTLRSILRQDPDVVLVGEIRDAETARIAIQAAMTGHLVFSTLHTNDAVGALPRLHDMGVPNYAINSALLGVVAQRLVRRVCEYCAMQEEADSPALAAAGLQPDEAHQFVRSVGCPKCMSVGYRGRLGVYELFKLSPSVRVLIDQDAPGTALQEAAIADGMRLMWHDGLDKARLGLTTLEELAKLRAMLDEDEAPAAMRTAA